MEYSTELKQLTTAYNLTAKDILLCFAVASGLQLCDAYSILFARTNTPANEVYKQSEDYLKRNPAAKILINRIKTGKKKDITKDPGTKTKILNNSERDELKTRAGIIEKLIKEVSQIEGKDAVSGLQTLAKLQGYDKPEETDENDKRFFVVPFLSSCRSCKLMQVFNEINSTEQKETP